MLADSKFIRLLGASTRLFSKSLCSLESVKEELRLRSGVDSRENAPES